MKRAGAKNPGAWARANKGIKKLVTLERTNLASLIVASEYIDTAYNEFVQFVAEAGIEPTNMPQDATAWATTMATNGIPLQVWMGRYSFTTYQPAAGDYRANYQSGIHYFAKDLRKIVRNFLFGLRQAKDIVNRQSRSQGNPGGLPNATKGDL